jgi:hypothetical protein
MHDCRLFTTKCGTLGFSATDIQIGDVIVFVATAAAPFVIRRRDEVSWILVGEYCYLDSAMRVEPVGRTWPDKERRVFSWEDIVLVQIIQRLRLPSSSRPALEIGQENFGWPLFCFLNQDQNWVLRRVIWVCSKTSSKPCG